VKAAGGFLAATIALVPGTVLAQAQTQTYVDVQAGLGYSTNPLLVPGEDTGSGFARVSGSAFWGRTTERSATNVSAYVENSSYFNRYSNKQIFSLGAYTSRTLNERVRIYGDLGFSGDLGGMLSSRFYGPPLAPLAPNAANPASPVIVDPGVQPGFIDGDPDLYNLQGRQYQLSAQVGAAVSLSARDSMTVSVGGRRLLSKADGDSLNYNQFDGSIGYERLLNERLSLGGRMVVQYSDYPGGGSVSSIGPQATLRAKVSEQWDISTAIGFVRTRQDGGGSDEGDASFDLALNGSICRNLEYERFCGRISRRSQATYLGTSSTSTSASLDYSRRLSQRDSIQLTASVVRAAGIRSAIMDQSSIFYTLAGSYDRKISDRLSAGVNVAARRFGLSGPDPKSDLGGSIFLRYRLGEIR